MATGSIVKEGSGAEPLTEEDDDDVLDQVCRGFPPLALPGEALSAVAALLRTLQVTAAEEERPASAPEAAAAAAPQVGLDELAALARWDGELADDETALRARIQRIHALPGPDAHSKARAAQALMSRAHSAPAHALPPARPPPPPSYHPSGALGCAHYMRNCALLCSTCHTWHVCRLCHDAVADHALQSPPPTRVACMFCSAVQPPAAACAACGRRLARYFCAPCVLYDNDDAKDIYHCDACGICRLGLGLGHDFFHCDGCGACLAIELRGNHRCTEAATRAPCPICADDMFTSVRPVMYMSPCGHAIHKHCFAAHTRHSYKCPHCRVSVLNMEARFRVLDRELADAPLPEPYALWRCDILCNDCGARSTCRFHILGLRCGHCASYNTRQLRLLRPDDPAPAAPDDTQAAQRASLLRALFHHETVSPLIDPSHVTAGIDDYLRRVPVASSLPSPATEASARLSALARCLRHLLAPPESPPRGP
ncbi:AaceriAGL073CBp [[Ashbya] aceris (nom. inval.)]|nr:AaceriAGL073CBp [[Ashbya] aceris (nom. inval.)]